MKQPTRWRALAAGSAVVLGAALATVAGAAGPAYAARVTDPFSGAKPYLNPDYVAEVQAQAAADGSSAEASVANYQTGIWMDKIAAIAGDSTHRGLKAHLDTAAAQATSSNPVLVEVVVYDLPGRDCAALASNGELPATSDGLNTYETQYIDPISSIESSSAYSNLRIVNIVEPDSLPNAVTNQSKPACQTATPYYETGIEYALNKLHAIGNTYNYLDIAHSAWLGWSSNFTPAVNEFAKVAKATTAGMASIDGFISNTANYTPTTEPYMTADTQVGGQPVRSQNFYQWNTYIDELHYDQDMRTALVGAGFSSNIGMLIDTSRNGWGGPNRPTGASTSTDLTTFVNQTRIDRRPFRGDWCNQDGAGIGARPQDQPASGIQAYVWIKPPGESDGDYPTASHTHGDPHCDPSSTNTDGNGGTYSTGSIPGYDVPAGNWYAAQFQQLVNNAYPSLGGSTGGDTTPPSTPSGLKATGTTSSSVSLSWTASTDNVGVTGYNIYRGSTLAGTSTGTTFTDTGLTANTAYSYTVKAFDAAGNLSAASTAVSATTSGSTGGGGCTASYHVDNDWGSGYTATVTITNGGSSATKGWKVSWTYGGSQKITNFWNTALTQSGTGVSATNLSYNGAINPGQTTSFGFQGTYTGTNSSPTPTCTAS